MTEEDARGLCELAAVDLRMAKGFADRALAEEDPDIANGLARSYQRAARSYRQTLALKMRLRRDLMHDAREDRSDARAELGRRNAIARSRVFSAVKTLVWNEREAAEAEELESDLGEMLDDHALADDFADIPVTVHVTRLAQDLGLASPANEGGSPPIVQPDAVENPGADAAPARRSSG
jgi:hypothetical protein